MSYLRFSISGIGAKRSFSVDNCDAEEVSSLKRNKQCHPLLPAEALGDDEVPPRIPIREMVWGHDRGGMERTAAARRAGWPDPFRCLLKRT